MIVERLILSIVALVLAGAAPASAWCIANSSGAPVTVAVAGTEVTFDIAAGRDGCCDPERDGRCVPGDGPVSLSIAAAEAACEVEVVAKGHVNVTSSGDGIRCKALKPGQTMDWGR